MYIRTKPIDENFGCFSLRERFCRSRLVLFTEFSISWLTDNDWLISFKSIGLIYFCRGNIFDSNNDNSSALSGMLIDLAW